MTGFPVGSGPSDSFHRLSELRLRMGFCMGFTRAQPACVKGFALDHLFLSGPDVGIKLAAIEAELRRWRTEKKFALPSPKALGVAMADLFAITGIKLEDRGGRLMAIGVSLKTEPTARFDSSLNAPGSRLAISLRPRAQRSSKVLAPAQNT